MKPVLVPTTDVNSTSATIVQWHAPSRSEVQTGALLAELETSKAVIEVVSPGDGVLLHAASENAEVALDQPIARIFDDLAALEAFEREGAQAAPPKDEVRATLKARARASELGVDLRSLDPSKLITVKDVEAAAEAGRAPDYSAMPAPLSAPGKERVLLIGGGLGATQVIDILRKGQGQAAVGILDDSQEKWGEQVYETPVLGGTDRLEALFAEGGFDKVIVAISTSVAARAKFLARCQQAKIPLANAIDPSATLSQDVRIGEGNVICAFCHFGTSAIIGDNNFFSAYNSYDHHNELGSNISTGPGCMTSGRVTLKDQVRMGTGVFIEPGLELGEGAMIASGAIIVRSVPAHHAVKTKIVTTTTVPIRGANTSKR